MYTSLVTALVTNLVTTLKRGGQLLLPLPLCVTAIAFVALAGCDNQAYSTTPVDNAAALQAAQTNHANPMQNTDKEPAAEASAALDSTEADAISDNEDDNDVGLSLMAAAKSDDRSSRRAPMISEQQNNTLQATLIGDYVGMLPCASCDSIAVTLNLFSDGSVLKTSIYDQPESPQTPIAESGIYRQDNDMITIVYERDHLETYLIQDNHLVMLDDDKVPNADYTLARK